MGLLVDRWDHVCLAIRERGGPSENLVLDRYFKRLFSSYDTCKCAKIRNFLKIKARSLICTTK
jgi:hypothetical protein